MQEKSERNDSGIGLNYSDVSEKIIENKRRANGDLVAG